MTPARKTRTLPTARLTSVVVEAAEVLRTLRDLHSSVRSVVNDWGQQPPEAALHELREALDRAALSFPIAITEALAYLKVNGRKLQSTRRRQSRIRGQVGSDFIPEAAEAIAPPFDASELEDITLDLSKIEEVLKSLNEGVSS